MKKKLLVVGLASLLVVLTACSASTFSTTKDDTATAQMKSTQTEGVRPTRQMDLLGKVVSAGEKKVVVAGLQMPEATDVSQPPQADTNAAREINYMKTGTSYTIIIAEDTPIFSRTAGIDGSEETSIDLSDLHAGDILRIWLDELNTSGESTAVYVELESQQTT